MKNIKVIYSLFWVILFQFIFLLQSPITVYADIIYYDYPVGMSIVTNGRVYFSEGRVEKSFHANQDGLLTVYKTVNGERVGEPITLNTAVKASFTNMWTDFGSKDREIIFKPSSSSSKTTTQREAFFIGGVMQNWDDYWVAKPDGFSAVWPFIEDVENSTDLFVGVDLTVWNSSAVAFKFGDTISITNGQSDLLSGFTIGVADMSYVEGVGWVNSAPFTGQVRLGASDGSVVPEPSITLLTGLGLIGMGYAKRQKTQIVA
jgi:hypothetical protein